jgi:hypothetical protein
MNLLRYLDLAKFVSLLQTRAIHFTRIDQFKDQYEGSYPLSDVDVFGGDSSGYSSEQWKKFVAVSCWYHSDIESDAMWRLYTSDDSQGIAIKTTWDKLKAALGEQVNCLTRVKYIDFVKDKAEIIHPFTVFEYKRKAYIHENEVRAIIIELPKMEIVNGMPLNSRPIPGKKIPKDGIPIEVELNSFIDQVVVNPRRTSWFLDVVNGLCEKYGLPAGIVVESELRADPVYAKI